MIEFAKWNLQNGDFIIDALNKIYTRQSSK